MRTQVEWDHLVIELGGSVYSGYEEMNDFEGGQAAVGQLVELANKAAGCERYVLCQMDRSVEIGVNLECQPGDELHRLLTVALSQARSLPQEVAESITHGFKVEEESWSR